MKLLAVGAVGWAAGLFAAALLAQISDAVWLAVLGLLTVIAKEYFDARRAREIRREQAEIRTAQQAGATRAEEVKSTLQAATLRQEAHLGMQDEKLDTVAAKVEEVKRAADGLTEKLISKAENAGRAQGELEARSATVQEVKAKVEDVAAAVEEVKQAVLPEKKDGG